jgi:hypothetical protein
VPLAGNIRREGKCDGSAGDGVGPDVQGNLHGTSVADECDAVARRDALAIVG